MSEKEEITFSAEQVDALVAERDSWWSNHVGMIGQFSENAAKSERKRILECIRKIKHERANAAIMGEHATRVDVCEEIMRAILEGVKPE